MNKEQIAQVGNKPIESSLGPYRVLDLTDSKGYLCGSVLGGLGAEVIKIEPPGGDGGRKIGPFYHDIEDPEKSLYWFAYNLNKKSITLDLKSQKGQEIFKRLVKTADFVIESFHPGYLNEIGLGYDTLSEINPKIVMTSITPFGQTGPRSQFKGPEIACWASSGYMWLCGYPDKPPVRFTFPQAYLHGSLEAVLGSLMAFRARQITGEGQYVDVSIQESIPFECLNAQASWDMNKVLLSREGAFRVFGSYRMRYVFRCKDGYMFYHMIGGSVGTRGQKAITEWMDNEGFSNDFLRNFDWENFDSGSYNDEMARALEPIFEKFMLTKTKEELFRNAVKMHYIMAPMNDVKDMLDGKQYESRNYWVDVEHPELGDRLTYPGAPFKSNATTWQINRRAPLIGEHNQEIYKQLGISDEEITTLKGTGTL